ncbi:ubiquitin-like protease domain-containing protein [Chloropicon primus]|uniref:Ubiquitin-like protease family profile domain-containing protein n=1 Tax=Chloropicon primus TaxID=1764295 RepID=A0A5B8MV44_9CHLO|nr:hypothetical protein A3770_12p66740 [Chloropicon primus]UPR03365.1 ubiquitin-like protease domain-containing protein [Chloropicon primus]|eukprot:QDZ24156.1 hypothetical protein A3770_12p66740 [Chloropicon primus]
MEESGDSRVVLDYGDILLRRGDVLSLMEGEWLNDQVISFYFEYLKTSSKFSNLLGVELLHTSLVHLISCMPDQDQVDMILEPLALAQKDLVFAAVNDSEDTSQPDSGSHWSLLVCERTRGAFSFYHFDSMGDSNRAPALALAAKLRGHLGSGGSLESVSEIPRQTNCHDCGVYVLAVAEAILKEREGTHDDPESMSEVSLDCRGHLHVLQWARSQGPPCDWNEETCWKAARGGHLDVLQWARSQDPSCPWNPKECKEVAMWRPGIFRWIQNNS